MSDREPPENDLHVFLRSATDELENEYRRIQNRVHEDPGTAGIQGDGYGTFRTWPLSILSEEFDLARKHSTLVTGKDFDEWNITVT